MPVKTSDRIEAIKIIVRRFAERRALPYEQVNKAMAIAAAAFDTGLYSAAAAIAMGKEAATAMKRAQK